MKHIYKTQNTCSKEIRFDLNKNIVTNIEFLGGGCPGNLQAVPRLANGLTVKEIQEKLSDIKCGFRGTSCASELAKAVTTAYEKSIQEV